MGTRPSLGKLSMCGRVLLCCPAELLIAFNSASEIIIMKLFGLEWLAGALVVVCVASLVASAAEVDQNVAFVERECKLKLRDINSIEKFEEFMMHYKELVQQMDKPKRGLLNLQSSLRKCYDIQDQLFELEDIVNARGDGVCRMSYIDRLVDFHLKYLSEHPQSKTGAAGEASEQNEYKDVDPRFATKVSPFVSHFFTLYALQVANNCKANLIERVREAHEQQDCSSTLYKFMPQLFSDEPRGNPDNANLSDEVADFVREFRRVEDYLPVVKFKSYKVPDVYMDIMIPDSAYARIEAMKAECRQREPLYTELFAPTSTLAQLGYTIADHDALVEETTDTAIMRCWLATAQLCQGVLRAHMNINNSVDMDPELQSKFVAIKWGDHVPGDARDDQQEALIERPELSVKTTVGEISPMLVDFVKTRYTFAARFKRRAAVWVQKFIEKHLKMEAKQKAGIKKFLQSITDTENSADSRVAFSGKKYDTKDFNPVSVITNDADTVVKMSSSFWNKEVGLMVSSVVAIVMSAVFVWFSLYALATSIKQNLANKEDVSVKSDWKKLRDARVHAMEEKFKRNRGSKMSVYKPM